MSEHNVTIISPIPVTLPDTEPQLMNTITETARLCRERNIGLNQSIIRYLCTSGAIPCVRIGSKTLVNWRVLMEYINRGGDVEVPAEAAGIVAQAEKPADNIRRLPVKLRR